MLGFNIGFGFIGFWVSSMLLAIELWVWCWIVLVFLCALLAAQLEQVGLEEKGLRVTCYPVMVEAWGSILSCKSICLFGSLKGWNHLFLPDFKFVGFTCSLFNLRKKSGFK